MAMDDIRVVDLSGEPRTRSANSSTPRYPGLTSTIGDISAITADRPRLPACVRVHGHRDHAEFVERRFCVVAYPAVSAAAPSRNRP
jgi:hypothetical protein